MRFVRWYTGVKLEAELLCEACAVRRDQGDRPETLRVCEACHARITDDVGVPFGFRGSPGVPERPLPMDLTLRRSPLPRPYGPLIDLAPVGDASRSLWLLLFESGVLVRWDADSGDSVQVAQVQVDGPEDPEARTPPKLRLHASKRGDFAAVCRDYGRHGAVVDLRGGKVTLLLNGGDYHSDTVPLSFAFAEIDGRTVAIHRTEWNRLDLSDPATGELLSAREYEPRDDTQRDVPVPHALDYFHGALYVSPDERHVLDDGWVWHPVGVPMIWDLDRWRMDNPWESEDGPSQITLCIRPYCWDRSMVWLDGRHIILEGIGDDDEHMIPGARIFDITVPPPPEEEAGLRGTKGAKEIFSFPGPVGLYFAGEGRLYSSEKSGLSVWDPATGDRLGRIPGFSPSHRHPGSNELVEISDGVLVRWTCPKPA